MPLRTTARIAAFNPGQSPPPLSTPTRTVVTITAPVRRPRTALLLALVALAACGSTEEESRIPGGTLTIYSSLPAHGVSAAAARAVAAGEALALADAGARAGR